MRVDGEVRAGDSPVRAWLRARARLTPGALSRALPAVRRAFAHDWAPMQALEAEVQCLPAPLWRYLLSCEGGRVVIGPGPSTYGARQERGPRSAPGEADEEHQNMATIALADLAARNERVLHVIGHLIDHYLGCRGAAAGPWLSEGGGVTPAWQEAGRRLGGLFALGYGVDAVARSSVRNYLAQSLAVYCHDRQRLNVADPQIYRWFRSTLWQPSFWKGQDPSPGRGVG